MKLEYRLNAARGSQVLTNTLSRRAKADGEDLLTPLVAAAAEAIGVALVRGSSPTP